MNLERQNDAGQRKRTYEKPSIIQIPLRQEEAVLGNCKNNTGAAGPGAGSGCKPVGNCFSIGS
jgi:hypothetical protein